MKRVILAASLIALAMMLISCGNTKHCDAYSSNYNAIEADSTSV